MKLLEHKKVELICRKMHGFTLMELMIVVAIVGILAGVAYPAYLESGRRAKRSDGRGALLDAATRLERFYSDNNQYTNDWGAAPTGANIDSTSEKRSLHDFDWSTRRQQSELHFNGSADCWIRRYQMRQP